MRDDEREIMERLVRIHPKLKVSEIEETLHDPPDAVIDLNGLRLGFEITRIFARGSKSGSGNNAQRYLAEWNRVKRDILSIIEGDQSLAEFNIQLTFKRQGATELDPANLPSRNQAKNFSGV